MNVKELIAKLKLYPDELEVTDGNRALHFIAEYPGYYDGAYTKLTEQGAIICSSKSKLRLHFISWDDVLIDEPEAPIEFDGEYAELNYSQAVAEAREKYRRLA